jgi:CubicO group peptidase (beta-lactamase class C family)
MDKNHSGMDQNWVSADLPDEVVKVVKNVMLKSRIPGVSIAALHHDRLICAQGFGFAELRNELKATPESSYLWFSLSKVVTATAVLRLADEDQLELEAPITKYFSGLSKRVSSHEPTVRQLLNHTAGLANPFPIRWVRPAGTVINSREFLEPLLNRRDVFKYEAGGRARYSNLGYLILAEIISDVSGQPFQKYVENAVLLPTGMTRTGYDYQVGAPRATGYIKIPAIATPLLKAVLPGGIIGTRHGRHVGLKPFLVKGGGYGGVVGDVVDAARFAALHLGDGSFNGHQVLATQTAQRMRQIDTPGKPFDFGMAWFRHASQHRASPAFVEHHGAGAGFYNVLRIYPSIDLGIVVMANTTASYNHEAIFDAMRRAL